MLTTDSDFYITEVLDSHVRGVGSGLPCRFLFCIAVRRDFSEPPKPCTLETSRLCNLDLAV